MTDAARLTTPERRPEDLDAALRPKTLDEFIGQRRVREQLQVFIDAAKQLDVDDGIAASGWRRSAGGGLFLIASVIRLNLDVARGLGRHGGDTRIHLSSGFSL